MRYIFTPRRSLGRAFAAALACVVSGCGGGASAVAPPIAQSAAGSPSAAAVGTSAVNRATSAMNAPQQIIEVDGETATAACPTSTSLLLRARCYVYVSARRASGRFSPSSSSGFYSPAQLQAAYKLPSSANGSNKTVFIVDAYDDPNVEADLGVYRSNYGLPACTTANGCFRKLNQSGAAGPYPTGDMNWGEEISLDTQMVSAICPNCHIVLIEANSNSDSDLYAGVDEAVTLKAKFISTSWGNGEYSSETSSDTHFDHAGVMITNSSGDGGYAGGTQYPAASPYVTAVGGTTLRPATNARGWSEVAWPSSGSGCSGYEAKPSWQIDNGCTNRTIADVSAVADSVAGYDSYESDGGGWYSFFGTSVSSPIIASVYALAGNAAKLSFGSRSYAYTDKPALWDARSGHTGTCSPAYLCTAGEAYDGPTGNGTPHGIAAF